ncbi:MAG TPA: DNA-formamidopyrimidine glycosylase family protein, partial [Actinomycetota bacterium]|nr:DNA-formamidopyrimidine glycosylase family protein [Actinomycetota bacterium]
RHGKRLLCPTEDGPTLLVRFGMTGGFVAGPTDPPHPHDRLILELDRGGLRYRDQRKLGGVWLAPDEEEAASLLSGLGPDALEVGRRAFLDRLSRRRGGVKAALMDQGFVAGVGNLLADEILWQAGLHPRTPVAGLDPAARERLYRVLRRVLRTAVARFDHQETQRRWLIRVRGLPGARCPRCGTALDRTAAAGRTTYFCPTCQPLSGPPAGAPPTTPAGGA